MNDLKSEWFSQSTSSSQPTTTTTTTLLQKWWNRIESAYAEPQRAYHTCNHIAELWSLYNANQVHIQNILLSQPEQRPYNFKIIFLYATIFHDIVYDPQKRDNEEKSIIVFREYCKEGGGLLDEDNRNLVEIIIHATITHTPPPTTLLIHELIISFFLDMDLSVLGRDEVGYNLYSKQIRQEYIHMSPTDYASGRAGVLRSFLTRGDLMYYTTHFRGLFLDKAKMNLELELAQLEKGSV